MSEEGDDDNDSTDVDAPIDNSKEDTSMEDQDIRERVQTIIRAIKCDGG